MRLILASGSKNRQDLFKMVGLKYEVIKSDKDEESDLTVPEEYVKALSRDKANNVADKVEGGAIIVAADTIMYKDNKFYEKPKSLEEAANNLRELSGKSNFVTTGITVKDLYNNKEVCVSVTCELKLKEITEEDIEWYLGDKYVLDRCCYSVQGRAAMFIESVYGDLNNALGFSLCKFTECLKELGYELSDFESAEQP